MRNLIVSIVMLVCAILAPSSARAECLAPTGAEEIVNCAIVGAVNEMIQEGKFVQMHQNGEVDLNMSQSQLEDILSRVVAWRDATVANFIATEESGIDIGDRIILAAKTAMYDPAAKLDDLAGVVTRKLSAGMSTKHGRFPWSGRGFR